MRGVSVRQKVKGGSWWIFIKHRGQRRSKLVGDKKAAEALAKELRAALAAGDLGLMKEPAPDDGLTFESYAKRYLDRMEHELKRSTWRDYAGCTRRKLIPAFPEKPLASITRTDVKALAESLRAQGLKTSNLKKHLRILSSILSEAVEDELIPSNPVRELRKPRRSRHRQASRKLIDPFTAEELVVLLKKAETHTIDRRGQVLHPFRVAALFLLLLARTGLRLSEAIALRWGDIDWRDGRIHVQRAYVLGELAPPKSGKDRRVDMSDGLKTALRAAFDSRFATVVAIDAEAQAALEAERAAVLDTLVFPDSTGGFIDDHNLRRRIWAPLLVAAELRPRRLHDLRHTFASLLLQHGAEPLYVSEQLGHHSPAFTLDRYAHLLPRNRRGFVNRLDALAPAGTPGAPESETTVSDDESESEKPLVSQGLS